jgi:hypothetical protein
MGGSNKMKSYDNDGRLIFDMKTCTSFNPDSTYKFLDTESHAYLIVPIDLIKELNITKNITEYSYTNGIEIWLEEDQDAYTFIKAYVEYFKQPFQYGMDYTTYEEWEGLIEDCLVRYSTSISENLMNNQDITDVWRSDKLINQDAINNLSIEQLEKVNEILNKIK